MADRFQRVFYRLPVSAQGRVVVERFLMDGSAHVQYAFGIDGKLPQLSNPLDRDEALRKRKPGALAAQGVRRAAGHDHGVP